MTEEGTDVAKLTSHDPATFAALYDKYAGLVYGLAYKILQNRAPAEDVTQSIFVALWANPDSFRGGNFGAWIARVARNASIDFLRSSAVRARASDLPLQLAAPIAVDDEVVERVQSAAVTDALRALPDDQRTPIEIAYFHGLSYREVADRLGEPVGTVKSRIRAGLRRMSQALGSVRST
jgi:RNA polymerase sigma-70 factor (ECF subfamily)